MSDFSDKFVKDIKDGLSGMVDESYIDFDNVLEYIESLESDVEYWKSKAENND